MVRGSSKVGANRRWQTSMLLTVARLVSQSKFIFQQDRLPVIVHHQKKQTRCLKGLPWCPHPNFLLF
jgi:hypothetical protein